MNKDTYTHYFDNGHGAVEPFGFPEIKFGTGRIIGVAVDDENRGYCLLCPKLTVANIPLEEAKWYRKAVERMDEQEKKED